MKSIAFTFSFMISVLVSFGQLTNSQKYDISFMREEEKLARDVYDSLYAKWGLRPFANIRESEQRHMDRVLSLIKAYGLTDPVDKTSDIPGKFLDKTITEYYSALVTEGSKSAIDALMVGAKIEEIDIRDLVEKSKNFKDPDVLNSFKYLREASERHLNAFVRNLRFRGVNYIPVILDKSYYDGIIENE